MNSILRFEPVYQERVWGGRALAASFGRTLPGEAPIGESWEVVDRGAIQSTIKCGYVTGKSLRDLIESSPCEIMGPGWSSDRPFPILVKWLDCRERLSLQVHPPATIAPLLKGEPKTEMWFIAETQPGAGLLVGLKTGVTRERFEEALSRNELEPLIHRFPVAAGDSILVHSGRIHAIDAGNLILEIQQNSDTTYRVYDWGRAGLDGRPRQIHVKESLASIQWNDFEPSPVCASPIDCVLADCDEFRIRRVVLKAGAAVHFARNEQPRILSVVTGELKMPGDAGRLVRGENAVLPYAGEFTLTATTQSLVLVTENFNSLAS